MSQYSTFAGSPILLSDYLGDSVAVYGTDGSFMKKIGDGNSTWSGAIQYNSGKITLKFTFNDGNNEEDISMIEQKRSIKIVTIADISETLREEFGQKKLKIIGWNI